MTHFDPVSLPELLDRINASKYREKTKKKLRRIAKKANGCVSLAAVQKDCRIKKSDLIKLLGKFEEMGGRMYFIQVINLFLISACRQFFSFVIICNLLSNGLLQGI